MKITHHLSSGDADGGRPAHGESPNRRNDFVDRIQIEINLPAGQSRLIDHANPTLVPGNGLDQGGWLGAEVGTLWVSRHVVSPFQQIQVPDRAYAIDGVATPSR